MSRWLNVQVVVALVALLVGVLALILWIPNDIAGEAINYARRRYSIGDPFAPILISWLMVVAAVGLLLSGFIKGYGQTENKRVEHGFRRSSIVFMVGCGALLAMTFVVMRYAGPLAVDWIGPEKSYQLLVTTPPWHYLGYLMGAFVLMVIAISAVERQLRVRTLIIAVAVPLVIALAYDLPFGLILPPNGRADAG